MTATADYSAEVLSVVERLLAEHLRGVEDPEQVLGSAEHVAELMVQSVPTPSAWSDVIGPAHTGASLARKLNISRQAVSERTRHRTLWGLKTADAHMVYPTSQFDRSNVVLPGLSEILRIFDAAHVDDWTVAGWLNALQPQLGDRTPLHALRSERTRDQAIALARKTAHRWSR